MEIVDLEEMRVRDLIVYYLRNEKKEPMAHRDAIIEYVRSSQPDHVKKGTEHHQDLLRIETNSKKKEKFWCQKQL